MAAPAVAHAPQAPIGYLPCPLPADAPVGSVEAWRCGEHLVLLGRPPEGADHSCDRMRCGSTGLHVLERRRHVVAPPDATGADVIDRAKALLRGAGGDVVSVHLLVGGLGATRVTIETSSGEVASGADFVEAFGCAEGAGGASC